MPRALFSAFNGVLLTAFCRPTDLIPIWFLHCFQSFLAGCFWGWGTLIALLIAQVKGLHLTLVGCGSGFVLFLPTGQTARPNSCSCPTLWVLEFSGYKNPKLMLFSETWLSQTSSWFQGSTQMLPHSHSICPSEVTRPPSNLRTPKNRNENSL